MSSENAKAVAKDVIENIRNNTKVVKGKIIKKRGYKTSVSKHPTTVTETQSYKDVMNPFVDKMIKERDRVILAMAKKKLTKVQYEGLGKTMDTLTKNIQLLSGKETERMGLSLKDLFKEE